MIYVTDCFELVGKKREPLLYNFKRQRVNSALSRLQVRQVIPLAGHGSTLNGIAVGRFQAQNVGALSHHFPLKQMG
jgi:hypothetical protein